MAAVAKATDRNTRAFKRDIWLLRIGSAWQPCRHNVRSELPTGSGRVRSSVELQDVDLHVLEGVVLAVLRAGDTQVRRLFLLGRPARLVECVVVELLGVLDIGWRLC